MKTIMIYLKARLAKFLWFSLFLISFIGICSGSLSVLNEPIKIAVEGEVESVNESGTYSILVKVFLMNAENRNIEAPKNINVEIELYSSSKMIEKRALDFRRGEKSKEIRSSIDESGVIEIRAKCKELLDGSTYILLKSLAAMKLAAKIQATIQTPEQLTNQSQKLTQKKPSSDQIKKPAQKILSGQQLAKQPAQQPAQPPELQPTQPPEQPYINPKITMMYSPQRELLADGRDIAKIQAFYIGEQAHSVIDIRLHSSMGILNPGSLRFLPDEDVSYSTLISTDTGEIIVEYENLNPGITFEGDKQLEIPFGPAITSFEIKASPPIISLEDKIELIVQLQDHNGALITTDKQRDFLLSIEKGRGIIDNTELKIFEGSSSCRALFLPTWPGKVNISASTPGILSKNVQLEIKFPWMLLLIWVFGGLIGGIAFWVINLNAKTSELPKVLIGIITGYLLYWSISFGVLVFVKLNYLNILSVFAISVIGGYAWDKVIDLIWKKLFPTPKNTR